MKKSILLSVGMIVFVGAVVVGATGAFFSDTETSTGNTFTAGAIDLQIDNESYYNGEFNQGTSWALTNLDDELFFSFHDLKPGDWGEDTISLHVNNNDAWACVDVRLDSNDDNGLTEPEGLVDQTDGEGNGELADRVDFIWWADDGDNVLEHDEELLPAGPLGYLAVGEVATVALASPIGGIFGDGPLTGAAEGGDQVYYIGKAWCFGEFDADWLEGDRPAQDYGADTDRNPSQEGMGVPCSGAGEDNSTQTDSLTATISFYAEQARNNDQFECEAHLGDDKPTPPTQSAT